MGRVLPEDRSGTTYQRNRNRSCLRGSSSSSSSSSSRRHPHSVSRWSVPQHWIVTASILLLAMAVDIAAMVTPPPGDASLRASGAGSRSSNSGSPIGPALVPSQAAGRPRKQNPTHNAATTAATTAGAATANPAIGSTAGTGPIPSQAARGKKSKSKSKSKPKPKPKSNPKPTTPKQDQQEAGTKLPQQQKQQTQQQTPRKSRSKAGRRKRPSRGNLPDVLWRHIPLEHVRRHPRFVPLPEPERILRLGCMEDVRNFRQESWQWDVLHEGRMTTSQAVAALGFLEPEAGEFLGVPRGLRRGGQGAYHRLRKPVAMTTLEEMNRKLCDGAASDNDGEGFVVDESDSDNSGDEPVYWTQPANFPFAAKYMVQFTEHDLKIRKQLARKFAATRWSIRMVWGNVQEATSLLTALNYFWKCDKGVVMKEIGMCGAGLEFNRTASASGLLLGATPDAVLCHSDGRVEAVEVKNHCPFVPNSPRNKNGSAFRLSQQSLTYSNNDNNDKGSKTGSSVMCQYIPQLMMEMLCIGSDCTSAVMVRQTATNGSLILRVHRDETWIEEMTYWLGRFHKEFVQRGIPPPDNFFLAGGDPSDRERYRAFLSLTKEIERSKIELLEHVPNRSVQRAIARHPVSNDLFLD
ncbi:unnamed protein product [Pseudo-nitzschia multistriata]|uniref:Uncharacterized protein n=1 Tax=Pseudo-nitzschia multistriata TaxID=183589 RepID=A0A448ZRQ4_9STRA|nr:unnamed protein product [Pseudo-nitzschia multistriata]